MQGMQGQGMQGQGMQVYNYSNQLNPLGHSQVPLHPEYNYLFDNNHSPIRPYLHLNKNYQEYDLMFPYEIDPPYMHFDHKRPRLVLDPYKYSILLKNELRDRVQKHKLQEMKDNLVLEEQKLFRIYKQVCFNDCLMIVFLCF